MEKEGIEGRGSVRYSYRYHNQTWAGKTTKEYKTLKGLKKENLRDNMTNTELILNMLAEASTKDISQAMNPEGFEESKNVAKQGGNVAKVARLELEARTGKKVVTALNAKTALPSKMEGDKRKRIKLDVIEKNVSSPYPLQSIDNYLIGSVFNRINWTSLT